ncbi:MAG TPA: glycosyltransferase family 2 protein [Chitinispirillaceae bacterium]|nr:glycosyltransferase family 2 protein [Chitinispirillaceae bacterium]
MVPETVIKKLLPLYLRQTINKTIINLYTKHVKGIRYVKLMDEEAAVTCLLKNADSFIEQFIDHYLTMGFKHIFILDNNSTDNTVIKAQKYPNVSIYSTKASVKKYQSFIKSEFARKTIHGGWCLDVDCDEFFDYPYSDVMKLSNLLDYLNQHKYSSVLTHMLDMFSDEKISYQKTECQENLKKKHRFYELKDVEKINYRSSKLAKKYGMGNRLPESELKIYFGGIRKKLYGCNCMLTKHSLFSRQEKIKLFPHTHYVDNSRIADISCVLLHYKFTSNAYNIAWQNMKSFEHTNTYSGLKELIDSKPDFKIKRDDSLCLNDLNDLVDNGFLTVSSKFLEHAHRSYCHSNGCWSPSVLPSNIKQPFRKETL